MRYEADFEFEPVPPGLLGGIAGHPEMAAANGARSARGNVRGFAVALGIETMITKDEKNAIFGAAMTTYYEWYGEGMLAQGACLYLNQVAMRELAMRGFKPVLQAGDFFWRMVPEGEDNGAQDTHFGYEFDLSQPFSQDALRQGLFPECHVWCALPQERCIIDFSTGHLVDVATQKHGFEWTAERPPQYVFGEPPAGAFYRPKLSAIRFVWRFIAEKMLGEEGKQIVAEKFLEPTYI